MSDSGFPIPPPTFDFLVFSLKMQAEMQLGLVNFGEAKDAQIDLPAARHSIDLLAMIQEKTKGNLTLEEQRLIENSLTELRFRFVQATSQAKQAAAQPAAGNATSASPSESAAESAPLSETATPSQSATTSAE